MNEPKATRYHRLTRLADVASAVLTGGFLMALVASGASASLRDTAEWLAGGACLAAPGLVAAALTAAAVATLRELLILPLRSYRELIVERRYGLSTQRLDGWLRGRGRVLALWIAIGAPATAFVYWAVPILPAGWWAVAAAAFALGIVVLAHAGPVLFLQRLHGVAPLQREPLRSRLAALTGRGGGRALEIYEWNVSDRTRRAQAALVGVGRTRRVLLSDTLLGGYSDDEIEVIVAHELAHAVHRDVWAALIWKTAVTFGGFFLAHRVLVAFGPAAGLRGPDDLAGLPLIVLALMAVAAAGGPVGHALSRRHEYRADRYALDLTQQPAALVSALRRLGAQNLSEERPGRLVELLFCAHPPLAMRIAAARAWGNGGAGVPRCRAAPVQSALSRVDFSERASRLAWQRDVRSKTV